MVIRNPSGPICIDDGTNITVSYEGTDMYRIRKSDGQMQIAGGYDSDVSI